MINPIKLIKSKKYFDEIQDDVKEIKLNPKNWRTSINGAIAALLKLSEIWIAPGNTKMTATVNAVAMLFVALGLYHAADKQNV